MSGERQPHPSTPELDRLRALRDSARSKARHASAALGDEWRAIERELEALEQDGASDVSAKVTAAIARLEPFLEQLERAGI
jgi:ubiquinone biosynthesis protein UbiJ